MAFAGRLACLLVLSCLFAGAVRAETGGLPPSLTVARTARAPTIDGRIERGEWDGATDITVQPLVQQIEPM
jgi:hypothetical protein